MFLKIQKDVLFDALSKVVPIADKRTTLPILSHLLFEGETNRFILAATDLEVGLKLFQSVETEETGILAIPSRKFYEIVKELPPGMIEIRSSDEYRIMIQGGNSFFHLSGMDPSDYPAFGQYEDVQFTTIDSVRLSWMIDKTLFAASNDDSRFNLNGVFLEQKESLISLVATDGHRLAYVESELGMDMQRSLVVPKKGLNELRRVLEGKKAEMQIGFDQKNAYLKTDDFLMTIRLVDGEYPDYRRVIPSNPIGRLTINCKRVLQALRRASIFTTEKNKGVNIQVADENMVLTAEHPEFGGFEEKIEAQYNGEPFDAIVNVYYFMDAINAIETEDIFLEYFKESGPIVVRPKPEANYFNLVMPMKR